MKEFLEKIKDKAIDLGATKAGFSDLSGLVPEEFSHLRYGITIMVRLSDEIINQIESAPTHTYFHHYRDINTLIDQICLRLSLLIQEEGYLAMNVPASQTVTNAKEEKYRAVFSHKIAGTQSGLGWIGKNDLFVTEEYGSRVRMGTILTNMPLECERVEVVSKCGECTACTNACPAGAIRGKNWEINSSRNDLLDVDKCAEHMKNAYKDIGRGSVCGLCLRVCPRGTRILNR